MAGRCTICQESFDPTEISALKCGHTFHLQCISHWLQKAHSCPVCRRSAKRASDLVEQLFFDCGEETLALDGCSQSPQGSSKRVTELLAKVQSLDEELAKATLAARKHEQMASKAAEDARNLRARNRYLDSDINNLRVQLTVLEGVQGRNDELTAKNRQVEAELKKLRTIDMLVNDFNENSDAGGKINESSAEVLKYSLGILKKKFTGVVTEKAAFMNRNKALEREITSLKREKDELYVLLQSTKELGKLNGDHPEASTPMKNSHSYSLIGLPSQPIPDHNDSLSGDSDDDICGALNLPSVKTTNMAVRANLAPRQAPVEKFVLLEDSPPIYLPIRRPFQPGKSTITSGKRFDGLGGRTSIFECATTSKGPAPVTPQRSIKRHGKPISKGKKKVSRVLTPKIRNTNLDDEEITIVLSD